MLKILQNWDWVVPADDMGLGKPTNAGSVADRQDKKSILHMKKTVVPTTADLFRKSEYYREVEAVTS
jgi:hypothetical protein